MRNRRLRRSIAFVAITLLLCSTAPHVTASTRQPVVDAIIRDGGPFGARDGIGDAVLDGSVVQTLSVPAFEDRGIIEFSLAGLSQPILSVELVLPVFSSNPFPFTIDVFGYEGDGAVTLADWDRGTLLTSFLYSGEATVTLDVTSFIRDAVAAGDEFAGFNFRFAGAPVIGPFVAFRSLEFPPSAFLEINESPSIISIDINLRDSINPKSKGKVRVAILTTDTFDATNVDPSTIRFGPTGTEAAPVHVSLEDVDGDGDIDMVLHFNTQDTSIVCGVTSVSLVGETLTGQVIAGSDAIRTVGCK